MNSTNEEAIASIIKTNNCYGINSRYFIEIGIEENAVRLYIPSEDVREIVKIIHSVLFE